MDMNERTEAIPPRKRRVGLLLAPLAALAVLGAAFSAWWLASGRWEATTADAYVGGDIVVVTPLTSGTVTAIYGDTTQAVQEGQVVVQLDDSDARLQMEDSEAALARAVREVRGLYAESQGDLPLIAQRRADLARAHAELASSEATLEQAESELKRREVLVREHFISAENLQIAQTTRDAALAQRNAAHSAVDAAQAALARSVKQAKVSGARVDNTSLEQHPEVRAAAVRVREAELALARTRVQAPSGGQVAKRSVEVGERVKPGDALMAVIPLDKVWVDANFKETKLDDVRIGQPVTLISDFYGGGMPFHGRVLGLAPGTGSAFALLPPQNATGNWVKIVQRLPVRIALDARELAEHPLRVGLSMAVTIDTHDRSGPVLTVLPASAPVAETSIYAQNLKLADALVAQIIADNLGRQPSPGAARAIPLPAMQSHR
jgi:membrane fusion protein (multidrug efflux system)